MPPAPETRQYLVPCEVAARLGVHVHTIYNEIQRGRLKCHKFGGHRIFISEQQLADYLRDCEIDN